MPGTQRALPGYGRTRRVLVVGGLVLTPHTQQPVLAQPSHITLENKVGSVEHLQCPFGCRVSTGSAEAGQDRIEKCMGIQM